MLDVPKPYESVCAQLNCRIKQIHFDQLFLAEFRSMNFAPQIQPNYALLLRFRRCRSKSLGARFTIMKHSRPHTGIVHSVMDKNYVMGIRRGSNFINLTQVILNLLLKPPPDNMKPSRQQSSSTKTLDLSPTTTSVTGRLLIVAKTEHVGQTQTTPVSPENTCHPVVSGMLPVLQREHN